MTTRAFALLLTGLIGFSSTVYSESNIRVQLFSKDDVRTLALHTSDGSPLFQNNISKGSRWRARLASAKTASGDVSARGGAFWVQPNTRAKPILLHGRLRWQRSHGRFVFVNELSLEDYVAGVLTREASDLTETEALRAQAIVSRTYALHELGRHRGDGFDFCDLTHCQVFSGMDRLSKRMRQAVEDTQGRVLVFNQKPVAAFYHSTCGGHTESPETLWGGRDFPYLKSVDDSKGQRIYCQASPHFSWHTTLTPAEVESVARSESWILGKESIQDVAVSKKTPEGRAAEVVIQGTNSTYAMRARIFVQRIGRQLGWNRVKSTDFQIQKTADGWQVNGHGFGHGVGFCQWGAEGMAKDGEKYPAILEHYFPGTTLLTWSES